MTQSSYRVLAWSALAVIFLVTIAPISLRPISGLPVNAERFLAFAVIGALFAAGYPQRFWIVGALVLLAAGGFELAQHLSPSRHGEFHDFVVKGLGGGFGLAASRVAALWRMEAHRPQSG